MKPEQFLIFAHALPEAMFLLSGTGELLDLNPAAEKMLTLPKERFVGKQLADLVTNSHDKITRYLKQCSANKEFTPGALRWDLPGDIQIDCHSQGAVLEPAPDKNQRRLLLRCTCKINSDSQFTFLNRELDALRVKYHKLLDDKDRLEEHVAQRTTDIARHAKELEIVNRELDQFAYVTSHDLKAPLRAIANLSEWIEEDIGEHFTTETRHQMDLLRSRVRRLEGLIEGILQYSRVGRISDESSTVDVSTLLNELVDSMAPPKHFCVEIAPDMPTLNTSALRLGQVFSNLINNAIKYNDKSNGQVKVGVKEMDNFFEFEVSDNGPGIEPQYHEKVFTIFQTLQARDIMESTGIGLTLVKKIVEDQGGKIRLESNKAQGATFIFSWPK